MMVFLQIIAVIIYANIANKIYRTAFPPRELLLIHGDRPIEYIVNKFESRKDKYKITKCEHIKKVRQNCAGRFWTITGTVRSMR